MWTSSDTTIATFVAPGRLVARRNGQVMVRALVDRDTGVGSVMIAQRLARLQTSPSTLALSALTAESTVVAVGLDARGHPLGLVPVSWTSEAPTIATVTSGGRVRAVDNGATRILAQSGAVQDTVTVTVEQRAQRVVILPNHRLTDMRGRHRLTDSRGRCQSIGMRGRHRTTDMRGRHRTIDMRGRCRTRRPWNGAAGPLPLR